MYITGMNIAHFKIVHPMVIVYEYSQSSTPCKVPNMQLHNGILSATCIHILLKPSADNGFL